MAKRLFAVVVLGCPNIVNGIENPAFRERVLRGLYVYEENKSHNPLIICTGYHIPGTVESQAYSLKRHLLRQGIPETDIRLEDESRSTLENAIRSKVILDETGIRDISVVTNEYHMNRTKYIFEHMCPGINIKYSSAPDGVSSTILSELQKLENRKMVNLRPKIIESTLFN